MQVCGLANVHVLVLIRSSRIVNGGKYDDRLLDLTGLDDRVGTEAGDIFVKSFFEFASCAAVVHVKTAST
jgi:hypothetical protein